MSKAPTTFSAIESGGRTYLFYTMNGNILCMISPPKEREDYGIYPVKLDGEIVTTPFARVSATAWISREGNSEVGIDTAILQYDCSPQFLDPSLLHRGFSVGTPGHGALPDQRWELVGWLTQRERNKLC